MNFYKLAIIFFYLITLISSNKTIFYLTKNSTKLWFQNFTKNISPKNPYCSICCIDTTKRTLTKTCGKHTMCIYQNGIYGPRCKGFLDIPFLEDEIDVIIDAHNTIRNKVALGLEERGNPGPQPTASNMRVLVWNSDLALIAHRWASQCVFGHDLCRDIPNYPVGQNIAKGNFAINHELSFIGEWFEYVQYINIEDTKTFQIALKSPLRQYTQIVWADTYQIGCARVMFQQTVGVGNTSYQEHFICNYGPTGNILGQPVYKIGKPCSDCPEGTGCSVNYQGLCGTEMSFDIVKNLESLEPQNNTKKRNLGLRINLSRKFKPQNPFKYLYLVIFLVITFY